MRPTLPHSRALQRTEQDSNTIEEYVSFVTHRGTRKTLAQRSFCTPTASALVHHTHTALFSTYALLKSVLLLLLVHSYPLLPALPAPPPSSPAVCRPVARMDKTLCSPHPGTNKTNSSSSDLRGSSSSRKHGGRPGSHSPGSGSLGGSAGAAGSRSAVLGNSMNVQQQQQARKRQLEGVLSKYTNLIQGWQNR